MVTKEQVIKFMAAEFPQSKCLVEAVSEGSSIIRHRGGVGELRPGGTVSGPVMMTVADVALYVAMFQQIGITPLAVTTSLTVNFLRKPSSDKDILGICRLIKVGKSLVYGEVTLYSEGSDDPVAHAVGTYSIPGARQSKAEGSSRNPE